MKRYFILFISLFFCFGLTALAEEEQTCTFDMKNKLSTEALKVSASYEFKSDESGTYFAISIYNISENLNVDYTDINEESHIIVYSATENGVYTFYDYNTTDIFRYSFDVYAAIDTGCNYKIVSTYLLKPKKNKYADMTECKYEKMKDFYYCTEWITSDFHVSDESVRKSIKEKANATSTTSKVSQGDDDEEYLTFTEIYLMFRKYLIIGLLVGIIVDIYCLYISFRKVRENVL